MKYKTITISDSRYLQAFTEESIDIPIHAGLKIMDHLWNNDRKTFLKAIESTLYAMGMDEDIDNGMPEDEAVAKWDKWLEWRGRAIEEAFAAKEAKDKASRNND